MSVVGEADGIIERNTLPRHRQQRSNDAVAVAKLNSHHRRDKHERGSRLTFNIGHEKSS